MLHIELMYTHRYQVWMRRWRRLYEAKITKSSTEMIDGRQRAFSSCETLSLPLHRLPAPSKRHGNSHRLSVAPNQVRLFQPRATGMHATGGTVDRPTYTHWCRGRLKFKHGNQRLPAINSA